MILNNSVIAELFEVKKKYLKSSTFPRSEISNCGL